MLSIEKQKNIINSINNPRNNSFLGLKYEYYIGQYHEKNGYKVKYSGAFYGLDDRGIDLICENKEHIIFVQCKCWAKHKTIHSNALAIMMGNKDFIINNRLSKLQKTKKIIFAIYTSANIGDDLYALAKDTDENVIIRDKFLLPQENLLLIKCIKSTGKYHIPFGSNYNIINMSCLSISDDRFYLSSPEEAISMGLKLAQNGVNKNYVLFNNSLKFNNSKPYQKLSNNTNNKINKKKRKININKSNNINKKNKVISKKDRIIKSQKKTVKSKIISQANIEKNKTTKKTFKVSYFEYFCFIFILLFCFSIIFKAIYN